MLPVSVLENNSTSILYELPAGKPNPQQQCVAQEERRDRVFQSSMKGANCWYYTFNFIRKRIGKNPSQELMAERAIESICSQRRKELTAYDDTFPVTIGELYSDSDMELCKRLDLKTAQLFLMSEFSTCCSLSEIMDGRSSIVPYIQAFINEKGHNNMCDFLRYKRASKLIEINMKFLSHFRTGVHQLLGHPQFKEFDIEMQAAAIDTFVRDVHADLYKLKKSTWNPLQGIDKLIEELKKKGPLMILGTFGCSSYIDAPFKMKEKISGRDIYAWRAHSKRTERVDAHSVLLVGAKKIQDKAFAFFIDSLEPSDPADKNMQKIYMISFSNLLSNIYSLTGRKETHSEIGYAYYGNFKV